MLKENGMSAPIFCTRLITSFNETMEQKDLNKKARIIAKAVTTERKALVFIAGVYPEVLKI